MNQGTSFQEKGISNYEEYIEPIKSSLNNVYVSGNLSSLQPDLTQKISHLCKQSLFGIEASDLKIIEEGLYWIYTQRDDDFNLCTRAKEWVLEQLHHLLAFPSTFLQENVCLTTMTREQFFVKILVSIEKSSRLSTITVPNYIIESLCTSACYILKQNQNSVSNTTSKELVSLLHRISRSSPDILVMPTVVEVLKIICHLNYEGKLLLSLSTKTSLWLMYPTSLESTILSLVSSCFSSKENEAESNYKRCVHIYLEQSHLANACSKNPDLFQLVIKILIALWIKIDGLQFISIVMQAFMEIVTECCDKEIISLFPDNLQPQVLFLFVSPAEIPLQNKTSHAEHFCNFAITSLEKETCTEGELRILLLLFPIWYKAILEISAFNFSSYSSQLLGKLKQDCS